MPAHILYYKSFNGIGVLLIVWSYFVWSHWYEYFWKLAVECDIMNDASLDSGHSNWSISASESVKKLTSLTDG